jgi:hypothetical protein
MCPDFQTLRDKHRQDSVTSLTAFTLILIIICFENQYTNLILNIFRSPSINLDISTAGYIILLTVVPTAIVYFLFLVTVARQDFYYSFDNYIFKKTKQIDKFICLSLLEIQSDKMTDGDKAKIRELKEKVNTNGKLNELMSVFYYYIEKPEIVNPVLKEHAFIYWADYFSSITLISFGIVFSAFYIFLTFYQFSFLKLVIVFAVLLLVVWNLYGVLRGHLNKKIHEIPAEQVKEIHLNAEEELLNNIRRRNFYG